MRLSVQVKPIGYFTNDAAKAIAEMTETHEPLVITQNGEATCVIQDIKNYEDTKAQNWVTPFFVRSAANEEIRLHGMEFSVIVFDSGCRKNFVYQCAIDCR
jgi:PHD/YefM family antitoxin component YafN of YafNO toxin-antitoxin module